MPRIRTVKPQFFIDGKIGRKSYRARVFFIGLWCLADRAGRLEEDHDLLKLQIIPYDQDSVEDCLSDLCPDFIIRYKIGEKTFIQIKNFAKHQKPHPKEAESDIPSPLSSKAVEIHGKPCNLTASKVELGREGVSVNGKGREGKEFPQNGRQTGFVPATAEQNRVEIAGLVRGAIKTDD